MFSFIIRFLKTKTNRDNQNLYWLKSHSSIKFIVYLGQEVKKKCLEVWLLLKPWYNDGITVIEGFTPPSALLNRHNQYLNGGVWNQPSEYQIGMIQHVFRLWIKTITFSHLNYKFHFFWSKGRQAPHLQAQSFAMLMFYREQ